MTVTAQPTLTAFEAVTFDLYRDIHKGIRGELFSVTTEAGRLDPSDRAAKVAFARRVAALAELLEGHAHHEDAVIQPVVETHLPALAERIAVDHASFERRVGSFTERTAEAVDAASPRPALHLVYGDLASFVSAYLAHQEYEERVIMPALETEIGVEGVKVLHGLIVSQIPPAEMAVAMPLMLWGMNVDDRAEALGAMHDNMPPELFAGVWGLAASVLTEAEHAAVGARIGIN